MDTIEWRYGVYIAEPEGVMPFELFQAQFALFKAKVHLCLQNISKVCLQF